MTSTSISRDCGHTYWFPSYHGFQKRDLLLIRPRVERHDDCAQNDGSKVVSAVALAIMASAGVVRGHPQASIVA